MRPNRTPCALLLLLLIALALLLMVGALAMVAPGVMPAW